jgi:hypothetical protein
MMMRSTLFKTNTLSLIFFSARSLKQQSMDIHVTPLGHIILIPSQPVFALYTNFLVFDLTRSMLEHTISSTRGEHSYRCSNTRSTALEDSTLTITPPIRFKNLKLTISLHFDLINFLDNS